jgi:hypothetical protein
VFVDGRPAGPRDNSTRETVVENEEDVCWVPYAEHEAQSKETEEEGPAERRLFVTIASEVEKIKNGLACGFTVKNGQFERWIGLTCKTKNQKRNYGLRTEYERNRESRGVEDRETA